MSGAHYEPVSRINAAELWGSIDEGLDRARGMALKLHLGAPTSGPMAQETDELSAILKLLAWQVHCLSDD